MADYEFNPDELPPELVGTKEPLPWEKEGTMQPKQYSKYQISKFLDQSRQYQVVVRVDTYEELIAALTEIKPLVDELAAKTQVAQKQAVVQPQGTQPGLTALCAVHNVPMVSAISKKGKEYWSHKSDDGTICFGKGWMPKQQ